MDFVVTWVDDSDPEWREELYKYKSNTINDDQKVRFRSWDNLHYWFRGVERFAPWVDKVHFVTWGHIPSWLNINHSKLNVIKHTDFIPEEYLPTFNTRTIELNLHRIEELSEEYVLFNDDVFLIDNVYEKDFFVDGKPCDMPILKPFDISEYSKTILNDLIFINKHFDIKMSIVNQLSKWINIKYGNSIFSNLFFMFLFKSYHIAFRDFHIALPSRKKTLSLLWDLEYEVMHKSAINRFRDYDTVNNYVQRYWNLASNEFHPFNFKKLGSRFQVKDNNYKEATRFIDIQKKPIICVNDDESLENFKTVKDNINRAFENLLSSKSKFEL